MNKFQKAVNAIYDYVYDVDPVECKNRIDKMLEFAIGLRHSFVDNDKKKPVSNYDVNMAIFHKANLSDLRVGYVRIGDKHVDLKER